MNYTEHYLAGTVTILELDEGTGSYFVVMDADHYQVRITPDRAEKTLRVMISAEWSDDHPGRMANYTPDIEFVGGCQPGAVTITDDGLLSVMSRRKSASYVVIHTGWTAQFPAEAIEPIRQAIELAEKYLLAGSE